MKVAFCVVFVMALVAAEPPFRRYHSEGHGDGEEKSAQKESNSPPYPPSGFTPAKEFKLPSRRSDTIKISERREKIRLPLRQQLPELNSLHESHNEFRSSKHHGPAEEYGVPVERKGEDSDENKQKLTEYEAPTNSYFPPIYSPEESEKHEVASFRSNTENSEEQNEREENVQKNKERKIKEKAKERADERREERKERHKAEEEKKEQGEEREEKSENRKQTSENKKENSKEGNEKENNKEGSKEKAELREEKKDVKNDSGNSNNGSNNNGPYIVFLPAPNYGPTPYQNKIDFSNVGYSTYFQQKSLDAPPFPYYYQPKLQPAPYYLPFNNNGNW